eukprot:6440641-Ditylum_brightwellii.AAC.3
MAAKGGYYKGIPKMPCLRPYHSSMIPFGSAPAPLEFFLVLESAFDLANYLIQNPHWDPDEIKDPLEELIPEKEELRPNLPFAPVFPLDIKMS